MPRKNKKLHDAVSSIGQPPPLKPGQWQTALSPGQRRHLETMVMAGAQAVKFSRAYRAWWQRIRAKHAQRAWDEEIARHDRYCDIADPLHLDLQVAWDVPPLAFVGPVDPMDPSAPRIRHLWDDDLSVFQVLLSMGIGVHTKHYDGNPSATTSSPEKLLHLQPLVALPEVPELRVLTVDLDLRMPDEDLTTALRVLRAGFRVTRPIVRPARARTWDDDYGWARAFALLTAAEADPSAATTALAERVWPRLCTSPDIRRTVSVQAGRLLAMARAHVARMDELVGPELASEPPAASSGDGRCDN